MNSIVPISDLQTQAKRYVDQVKNTQQAVVITQRGRAAAVLISYAEFEGLKATQQEMSYEDWEARLSRAKKESIENQGIELEAYIHDRKNKK